MPSKLEKSICETCGKEFLFYRSTLRGKTGRFCCKKCIKLSSNSGSFKDKGKLKESYCKECGSKFNYYESANKGKFCSIKCHNENDIKTGRLISIIVPMYGENNPAWKGGITPQTRIDRNKFAKKISKLVFKRDNYTCQICGVRGGLLHADHIDKWCDNKETRFDVSNCRTLCVPCHYLITFGRPIPEKSKWGFNNLRNK